MKVFISYKRDVQPDQTLAHRIFERLKQEGHTVFIDQTLRVGQEWAKEIERNVRDSDCLIVLLTAASSNSEMVKGEVQIARDQAAKSATPRILPVRLAFAGVLPYPLSAWLDPIQYALWRGEADNDSLLGELIRAMGGSLLSHKDPPQPCGVLGASPPFYSAPLPPPGGSLDVDDPRYIRREADVTALNLISQSGMTLTIKGSRQMGKSSLLVRTLAKATEQGKLCALIDFQLLGKEILLHANLFFRRFSESITEQLNLPSELEQIWDSKRSNSQNCTAYVERLLRGSASPITVAVDEADHLFDSECRSDFFGMLRAWHNTRAHFSKETRKTWKRLDLVLVTSTEPYLFIDRPHESPFNVGEVLQLSDFTLTQIQALNVLHDSPLFDPEVVRFHELLSGHPYLTRKALYAVRSGLTPEEVLTRATEDSGPFGDHLRNYFLRLLDYPELASALKQVALGRGCNDAKLAYRLEGAGLVKTESGKTIPRCPLYAQYFRERL
jgi:hypothetical protein